ncbi:MAG: Hsp20/alpha crystallin family protein [Wenzhouxiangellaceae bacterium]|nr:Hsp20/alpha crystallin family protein [Wenzhouxiangellaceae bacterium]
MAITRERSSLPALTDQMRRLFTAQDWPFGEFSDETLFRPEWSPAVDVKESTDAYNVNADLPGVDPRNVDITLENGVLTIRGEREEERKEEGDNFHRVERFSGSFSRRFMLPDVADSDGVEARMDKGVLKIRIPKTEKAMARKIEIKD